MSAVTQIRAADVIAETARKGFWIHAKPHARPYRQRNRTNAKRSNQAETLSYQTVPWMEIEADRGVEEANVVSESEVA